MKGIQLLSYLYAEFIGGEALFGGGPKVSLIFQPFDRSDEKTARFKESAQYESLLFQPYITLSKTLHGFWQ